MVRVFGNFLKKFLPEARLNISPTNDMHKPTIYALVGLKVTA